AIAPQLGAIRLDRLEKCVVDPARLRGQPYEVFHRSDPLDHSSFEYMKRRPRATKRNGRRAPPLAVLVQRSTLRGHTHDDRALTTRSFVQKEDDMRLIYNGNPNAQR